MRVGRFALMRSLSLPAEDPSQYMRRLGDLARILTDIPWLLAGGLTIPLTLGGFYRKHHDVDVAFDVDAFGDVDRAMQRAGYYLSTHFPMSLFGTCRFSVSVPMRATGWLARRRPRKLKFRHGAAMRGEPNLLAVVEALPYRVIDGCFVTCDGRTRLPLDRPLVGHRASIGGGHKISCLDLHYVTTLMKGRDHPKHRVDRAMLRGRQTSTA